MNTKTKKDELYAETLETYSIKLDRRRSLASMQEQLAIVEQQAKNPVKEEKVKAPKRVRNVVTGREFNYQDVYKNHPNLEVIEWHED